MNPTIQTLPRAAVESKLVRLASHAAVALGVLLSGFVLSEPAPYEIYMAALIGIWALFGLRLSRAIAPLLVFLLLFNIGGIVSLTQLPSASEGFLYVAVSFFLAFTAIFIAAAVEAQPDLLRTVFFAWIWAALATASLGILGYFSAVPGTELFTRYGRAAGAFEDPNVFGPFLTLPALYLLLKLVTDRPARIALWSLPLVVVAGGIFLSFSRGAWLVFALSALLLMMGLFLQSQSRQFRLRIIVMALAAVGLLGIGLAAALQIPSVADLFSMRAQLVQEYDGAEFGRFARHGMGFLLAMERPLGLGPMAFAAHFGEDPHNIWLKALADYSWLGFASYICLIFWTLAAGFRILLRDRPWQPFLLCAYSALVGHVLVGAVIDTDHWRHFYLLLGLVWACIALEWRHQLGLGRNDDRRAQRQSFLPASQQRTLPRAQVLSEGDTGSPGERSTPLWLEIGSAVRNPPL